MAHYPLVFYVYFGIQYTVTIKYLDFHIMTCLFSKRGCQPLWAERGAYLNRGVWNILHNPKYFMILGWRQWNCLGYSTWHMLINIWHVNAIRVWEIVSSILGGVKISIHSRRIMNFLPSQNISNQSPPYLLTTPLPNRISRIFYI